MPLINPFNSNTRITLKLEIIPTYQIFICSKLMNVFPSYLMLCNICGLNSSVKYPRIITDLSSLPDAKKSPPEDKEK
jgi:hypothetical protein